MLLSDEAAHARASVGSENGGDGESGVKVQDHGDGVEDEKLSISKDGAVGGLGELASFS